jgi:hypothetical protein
MKGAHALSVVSCPLTVRRKDALRLLRTTHNAERTTAMEGVRFDSCWKTANLWTASRQITRDRSTGKHEERGIRIDERTAATRWAGESMDYGLAVQVLLDQSRRARSNPEAASAPS